MADWDAGYVTDITYTDLFFRELMPSWIATVALLLGQRPPDLAGPLRVAELGCGLGFNDAVIAATYPAAEIWGFDFNPAHIEAARARARRVGLDNLHYEERSFAELAKAKRYQFPRFDIILLHGVWTWVAPEVRQQIVTFVRRFLEPGGFVYVSYNVATGWPAAMRPLQTVMRLLAQTRRGRRTAVPEVIAFIERLRESAPGFFNANPAAVQQIDKLRSLDPRYFIHEYMAAHWQPAMFPEVAQELAQAKCAYLGSATLTDNISVTSMPPAVQPLLAEIEDTALTEAVRDLATAQSFRKDLYRRGSAQLEGFEHLELIEGFSIVRLAERPNGELRITCSIGEATADMALYGPILEILQAGPVSLQTALRLPSLAGKPIGDVMQAFVLLISQGYAHLFLPQTADHGRAAALNAEIAGRKTASGDPLWLVAPAIGSAIPSDIIETLVVGELLAGAARDPERLASHVAGVLARTGRSVQQDGQTLNDANQARRVLAGRIATLLEQRLPLLQTLGIVV